MENNDFFADIAMTQHPIGNNDVENPPREPVNTWFPLVEETVPQGVRFAFDYDLEKRYEEFQTGLQALREKYRPFLEDHAPNVEAEAAPDVVELKEFEFRYAEEREIFTSIHGEDKTWEKVTIPDYRGPEGKWKGYYRTHFSAAEPQEGKRVILSFQSVDYRAVVYVNGNYVGGHEGFFAPFEFDVTDYLMGDNELVVEVHNDLTTKGDDGPIRDGDKIYAATGPGWDDAATGWHHCPAGAGIIGKVTVETRSEIFLHDLFVRPILDESAVEVRVGVTNYGSEFPEGFDFELLLAPKNFVGDERVEFSAEMKVIGPGKNEFRYRTSMPQFRLWNPEEPCLYAAIATIRKEGRAVTGRKQHFGMRSFLSDEESQPKGRFYFNNRPILLRGVNEMGHLQQCVMDGDMEQLMDDILIAKLCNVNYYRITQRPVQEEIYDYMDMLGMFVQTDLPLFSTLRRNQLVEAVKQAGEMELLIRSHPSTVLVTFINEPVSIRPNKDPNSKYSKRYALKGHRHLYRDELEKFFQAARNVIHVENPDRVIKNVEGDYDPPTGEGMPDFHSYTMWYSHHPIPVARLAKGYIPPVKPGWMVGCGEYGAEGLDFVELMKERYPQEWLQCNDMGEWYPTSIVRAQTNAMHGDWYKEQTTMEDWVKASQLHQAEATRIMTDAFRRRSDYISHTAIHLLIDAWPAGWMKTLVGCDRIPKLGYYAYMDSLVPYRLNLYCDRSYVYSGETIDVEAWLLNDGQEDRSGRIVATLRGGDQTYESYGMDVSVAAAYSVCSGKIGLKIPMVEAETELVLEAVLYDEEGNVTYAEKRSFLAYPALTKRAVDVYARGAFAQSVARRYGYEESSLSDAKGLVISDAADQDADVLEALRAGKNVVILTEDVAQESYRLGDLLVETKKGPKVYYAVVADGCKDYHLNWLYDEKLGYREFVARKYLSGDAGEELVYTYGKSGVDGVKAPKVHFPLVSKHHVEGGTLYVVSLVLRGKIGVNPNLDELLMDCIEGRM